MRTLQVLEGEAPRVWQLGPVGHWHGMARAANGAAKNHLNTPSSLSSAFTVYSCFFSPLSAALPPPPFVHVAEAATVVKATVAMAAHTLQLQDTLAMTRQQISLFSLCHPFKTTQKGFHLQKRHPVGMHGFQQREIGQQFNALSAEKRRPDEVHLKTLGCRGWRVHPACCI